MKYEILCRTFFILKKTAETREVIINILQGQEVLQKSNA